MDGLAAAGPGVGDGLLREHVDEVPAPPAAAGTWTGSPVPAPGLCRSTGASTA